MLPKFICSREIKKSWSPCRGGHAHTWPFLRPIQCSHTSVSTVTKDSSEPSGCFSHFVPVNPIVRFQRWKSNFLRGASYYFHSTISSRFSFHLHRVYTTFSHGRFPFHLRDTWVWEMPWISIIQRAIAIGIVKFGAQGRWHDLIIAESFRAAFISKLPENHFFPLQKAST